MWDLNDVPVYTIQIPLSEIWYPQVQFLSTMTKRSFTLIDPEDLVLLANQGTAQFAAVIKKNVVEGHCEVDYTNFPFDTQVCTIEFGILRYFFTGKSFDLILSREPNTFQFETFNNEEWQVVSFASLPKNTSFHGYAVDSNGRATNVSTETQQDVQTGFNVTITLKRYPLFYIINLGVPVFVLTVVGQTAFAIPDHADAKLVVPLTVLIGFVFVQSIVAMSFPRSDKPPKLGLYITWCVFLNGFSCLACAIIMWIRQCRCRVPRPLKLAIHCVHVILFPSEWPALVMSIV